MKITLVAILLCLPLMNGCVDDTTAEEPVAPTFYSPGNPTPTDPFAIIKFHRISDITAINFRGGYFGEEDEQPCSVLGFEFPDVDDEETCRAELDAAVISVGIDVNDGSWVSLTTNHYSTFLEGAYIKRDAPIHSFNTAWGMNDCLLFINSSYHFVGNYGSQEDCAIAGATFVEENFGGTSIIGEIPYVQTCC